MRRLVARFLLPGGSSWETSVQHKGLSRLTVVHHPLGDFWKNSENPEI